MVNYKQINSAIRIAISEQQNPDFNANLRFITSDYFVLHLAAIKRQLWGAEKVKEIYLSIDQTQELLAEFLNISQSEETKMGKNFRGLGVGPDVVTRAFEIITESNIPPTEGPPTDRESDRRL